jgi:hypothetical protein
MRLLLYSISRKKWPSAYGVRKALLNDILDTQMIKDYSLCLFLFIVSVHVRNSIRIILRLIPYYHFLIRLYNTNVAMPKQGHCHFIHTPNGGKKRKRKKNSQWLVYVYPLNVAASSTVLHFSRIYFIWLFLMKPILQFQEMSSCPSFFRICS